MASPPYRSPAASPPNPSHSALPTSRKRPALGMPSAVPPYPKKRKSSFFSTTSSSHPLRQTSFPPEEVDGGQRSPSVESDFTAVTGSQSLAASGVGKKRRRRKKDETQSVRSAGKGKTADTASRTGGMGEDVEEEDDDGAAGGEEGIVESGVKVDRVAEQKKMKYGPEPIHSSSHLLTVSVSLWMPSTPTKASATTPTAA